MTRRNKAGRRDERWSVCLILLILLCGWSVVVLMCHPRSATPDYELSPYFVETLTEEASHGPIYVPGLP